MNCDSVYQERNKLVALLATIYPSGKEKTIIDGWDEEWYNCVYIDFPWGQASWHFHVSEMHLFENLPTYQKPWNGHTTKEKYDAIEKHVKEVLTDPNIYPIFRSYRNKGEHTNGR